MNTIALLSPEIPQNTGNIARLCVVTNTKLLLVGPLGFELSDKYLKRAGMDYWNYLNYEHIVDVDNFLAQLDFETAYLLTTKTQTNYTSIAYPTNTTLVFGNETIGTVAHIQQLFAKRKHELRIPMNPKHRCLNLAVSTGIALYEVLRQQQFAELS